MAKKSNVTPRGELVRLARELNIHQDFHNPEEQRQLLRLIEAAQETKDPAQHLRDYAAPVAEPSTAVQAAELETLLPPPLRSGVPAEPAIGNSDSAAMKPVAELVTPNLSGGEITLTLPNLDQPCGGFAKDRFECLLIRKPRARLTLHRLTKMLQQRGEKLCDGQLVTNVERGVIWLLEKYGEAAGVPAE